MNKWPDNQAQGKGEGRRANQPTPPTTMDAASPFDAESLVEFARAHYAASYPNPDRHGCPDPTILRSVAQANRLPDETLRAHLFTCSECFQSYRTALALRRTAIDEAPWRMGWRDKLSEAFSPNPGLAWASVAALLLTIALLAWQPWRAVPEKSIASLPSTTTPTPVPAPPTPEALIVQTDKPSLKPTPPNRAALPDDAATVSIDLNEYVALRDGLAERKVITLAPALMRLQLYLPEGSLPGAYAVSLVNESNHPVAQIRQVRRNGKTLTLRLDLRRLTAQRLNLKLQHANEPAETFPVVIASR